MKARDHFNDTPLAALLQAGETGDGFAETLAFFRTMQDLLKAAVPHADAILATSEGRRRATEFATVNFEHLPVDLLAHQMRGAANCKAAVPLIEFAERQGWSLEAERVTCPVRVVWGTEDRILPWPAAAARFREDWLPTADWVVIEGAGHALQMDVPLETAQLILDFTRD
jgi:pimeloyl-ACP methyl ester carboxylesterase